MKKTKIAVGLMTAVLSAGALAGCDNIVKYSDDGKIISYNTGDEPFTLTADKLLEEYYNDSSKYQSIFDAIYSIVVRNYFTKDEPVEVIKTASNGKRSVDTINVGKSQLREINIDAQKKVDSDKKTAQTNAQNNGTSYNNEFETILSSKGAKDEDELKEKYVEELKKEYFDNNFYKYHVKELKNGDDKVKYEVELEDGTKDKVQLFHGYLNDMLPYHVSHILVKLEDGSGTNYANGTISESNAEKLYDVVKALVDGEDSFGKLAKRFSEDTGSANNYGDLGIMDYSTGYVNEFKLGIYAYENFMGGNISKVIDSGINIPGNTASGVESDSVAESFGKEIQKSFGNAVPTIDYSVFTDLHDAAKIDKDVNNKSVIDDSANFYPRNIIYNKYLNRHEAAFITTNDASIADAADDANSGFRTIEIGKEGAKATIRALSVRTKSGEWTPILCARAGSDYQGIHFIIVNRSPFAESDPNGVSLDEYYTTYHPEQVEYPANEVVTADGKFVYNPKETYINFSSSVTADTKSKADSLLSTVKSYDSERLNKYIFLKFFEFEGLDYNNETLKTLLNRWISRGFQKKEQEKVDAWEKTWNDYVDTLSKQNSEREKLVSQACRIAYLNGNGLDKNKEKVELSSIIDAMAQAMVDANEVSSLEAAKTKILSIRIGDKELFKDVKVLATGTYEDGVNYYKADGTLMVAGEDYIVGSDITGNVYVVDPNKSTYISEIADLFKKEGALCNDGKEHL